MSDIQKKIITVMEVKPSDGRTIVKDQDGKSYTVWYTKKDGSVSKASQTMQGLQVKTGSVVEVSYTVEPYADKKTGAMRDGFRVMSFAQTSGTPSHLTPAARPVSDNGIVRGQIVTNLAAGGVAAGKTVKEVKAEIPGYFEIADAILAGQTPSFEASLAATVSANEAKAAMDDEMEELVEDVNF